jgi:RimJ/RimL family protein N-acetyltransferase
VPREPITLTPVDLANDGPLVFRAWGHDRANFAYLTARAFDTADDASRYLASLFPLGGESLAFHVVHGGSDVVGIVKVNVTGHRAAVGYVIHRPYWGRGFATSAVQQVVERIEAMPGVGRIWATCALENRASSRVLEKCGFEREGILRNWVSYPAQGGRLFDNYSYVKVPARR